MTNALATVDRPTEEYAAQFANWVIDAEPGTPVHDELTRDYTRSVLVVASENGLAPTETVLNSLFNQGMADAVATQRTERGLVAADFTTQQWRYLKRRLFAEAPLPKGYNSAEWSGSRYLGWLAGRAAEQFELATR
jgi:hypothetical protein